MSRKTFQITMCFMAVIIGMLIFLNIAEENWEPEPDVVYPMTNQRIVWQGAGYNGIWAK